MTDKIDNPPAFPEMIEVFRDHKVSERRKYAGMELRDYFAAAALAAWSQDYQVNPSENIAKDCYSMADAMLKARQSCK